MNKASDFGHCINVGFQAFYLKRLTNFGNLKLQALGKFKKSSDLVRN
jgi:hypothetical protein